MPADTSEVASALDPRAALARDELAAAVLRLQLALAVGIPIWMAFGAVDWMIARHIDPDASLSYLWGLRGVGLALIAFTYVRLRLGLVRSRFSLRCHDVFVFSMTAVINSLLCIGFRGIESPYGAGMGLILSCHMLTATDSWRRNFLPLGLTALAYPVTLLAAAAFSPLLAAQLADPAAVGIFVLYNVISVSTVVFQLVAGHIMWILRREILEMRSLGRYQLKARLGRGGMGEVWAAWDQTLRRHVAIKLLRLPPHAEKVAMARFEREVRATSELTHPNTVRIFDCGTTGDGLLFYAMELLDGIDLAHLVSREGPLEPARAAYFIYQAARALSEAHVRGIIHRDIKPANLFVTTLGGEPDFLKVLDFGIAKVIAGDPAGPDSLTDTGYMAGTPGYIAPEVIRGEAPDARADVYGLGAVLYFLVTGVKPFEGPNGPAIVYAQLNGSFTPPSRRRGDTISPDLEEIIIRCLTVRRESRFTTARELASALAPIARESPSAASANLGSSSAAWHHHVSSVEDSGSIRESPTL
jgi:hypothetical protein